MDKVDKKLYELYKDCKNYTPDIMFPDIYNIGDFLKNMIDMCRYIHRKTTLHINTGKYYSFKLENKISDIQIIKKEPLIPFEFIFQCAVINIIEQLVYIKKVCTDNKNIIPKKEYIKSLFESPKDSVYEKDNLYRKFETLLKQTRNKTYKGVNHKFSSFFQFYEQFVFNETDKGYHTAISMNYPNLVYSLFNLDSLYHGTYIQAYNLLPNTSNEDACENIYNLYSNIYTNIKKATCSTNLAEFIIAERLYGLKSYNKITKQNISNSEKKELAQIIYYIRNFGYTPVHQYIIEHYTKALKEEFIYSTLKATTVIEKTMQTFINYTINLLNKCNGYEKEGLLDNIIDSLYGYLINVGVQIPYSLIRFDNFKLYYDLMDDVEDNEFLSDELRLYDLNPHDLKKYITIVSKRRRFGISYYFKLTDEKKYKYESVEKYSQKQYIHTLYGIQKEYNENITNKSFFHMGYRIKY